LVDREEEEYYVGRTEYDSPEVDCEVLIEKTAKLKLGEFYTVTIQKTEDFDLYASL
jgi:ribosomal protein S12 methylthiotransferase